MAALEETPTAPDPTATTSGSGANNSSSNNSSRPSTGSSSKISNSLPATPAPHTSKISTASANFKNDFMTFNTGNVDFDGKNNQKEETNAETSTNPATQMTVRYNRIFKKVSQDNQLVLFLPQRELTVSENGVESLMGIALIHENIMKEPTLKVFLHIVLVFRYGREDEELMGLRFCNEVIVAGEQIFPTLMDETAHNKTTKQNLERRNSTLVNNQGYIAVPFVVDMGNTAPPSVRLVPCRPYSGSPIGTSYEVQLFASISADEIPRRRKMVQMSLRILENLPKELPPRSNVILQKEFIFSDKPLLVSAKLDSGVYKQGEKIKLVLSIQRQDNFPHEVRKIKTAAIQQVGVAMFSSGSFKNLVGTVDSMPQPNPNDSIYNETLEITIELAKDYAWAAMDETSKNASELSQLAPTVKHSNKALFVVRVSYYVQVTIYFGLLRRPISLKLPFILRRTEKKHGGQMRASKKFDGKNVEEESKEKQDIVYPSTSQTQCVTISEEKTFKPQRQEKVESEKNE